MFMLVQAEEIIKAKVYGLGHEGLKGLEYWALGFLYPLWPKT
jgi:hypothetical protein